MSWDSVYLITAAQVKEITGKSKNIDDDILKVCIQDAQHDLHQVLGHTLYDLVEQADPVADATLGGDTGLATLFNSYAKKYLAWKTLEHSYTDIAYQADRNGVFKRMGNDYTPASGNELNALEGKARSRAESRMAELIRYIEHLTTGDPILEAYNTDVNCEPRTKEVKSGRIITRISRWQYPDGRYPNRRDPYKRDQDGY